MTHSDSAALPAAHLALRALVVLNRLYGLAVLGLLVALLVDRSWTLAALGVAPGSWIDQLIVPLQVIAALGLAAVPLNDLILRRLRAIVETVRAGDPFVGPNAARLRHIAWALLGVQLLSLLVGAIADAASDPAHPLQLDAGFSASGWLAVLLAFVLARVFAAGTALRDDLRGTV